jgi:hypothetical protein
MPVTTDDCKIHILRQLGPIHEASAPGMQLVAALHQDLYTTDAWNMRHFLHRTEYWKRLDKRRGPNGSTVRMFGYVEPAHPYNVFAEITEAQGGTLTHRFLVAPFQIAAVKTPRSSASSEFLAGPGDDDVIAALQDAMIDAELIEGAENLSTPTAWEISGAAGSFEVIMVRDGGDWEDPAVCFYRTDTRAVYLPPASAQKTLAAAWDWFEHTVDAKKRDMLTVWVMRVLADTQAWAPLAIFGADEQPAKVG